METFLSHLAVHGNASVSTERTALNALVFLYGEFSGIALEKLDFKLPSKARRLPTVFSSREVKVVTDNLTDEQPGGCFA